MNVISVQKGSSDVEDSQAMNSSKPVASATLLSCVVNLSNSIIGAGMFGLPYAFAGCGYVGGLLFLFISAYLSDIGLRLLSMCAMTTIGPDGHHSSFETITKAAFPRLTPFVDLIVAVTCFGIAVSYFVAIGDFMTDVSKSMMRVPAGSDASTFYHIFTSRRFWIVIGLFCVMPISFFKTFDNLKFASILSMGMIFSLVLIVILYAWDILEPCDVTRSSPEIDVISNECHGETVYVTSFASTMKYLGVFLFSFCCHQNIFPVVNEISKRSQMRINQAIDISVCISLVVFFVVATTGYYTYGDNADDNVLLNYPKTFIVTIMRIFIAIMLGCSYPLYLDPTRRCILSLIKSISSSTTKFNPREIAKLLRKESGTSYETFDSAVEDQQPAYADFGHLLHVGITITLLASSFIIAMVLEDLGIVMNVVGSTGIAMMCYILPGALFVKLHPEFDFMKFMAYVLFFSGWIIMPVVLYLVFTGN